VAITAAADRHASFEEVNFITVIRQSSGTYLRDVVLQLFVVAAIATKNGSIFLGI
jgi:hypothetical protein